MARDGKPTRKLILEQSRALVLEHGYAGTSIDQILERTGITKGAFFYHFKSKSALALALIEEFIQEDKSHMHTALNDTESTDDPLESLLAFVAWHINAMQEMDELFPGCLYASYSYEPGSFNQEINDKVSESILKWRTTFDGLLDKVFEKYTTSIKVDRQSLSDLFLSISEGSYIISRTLKEKDATVNQLQHLNNYFKLLFVPKK
ncbi:TetR/AcrR family transcriptional regulator [Galbibacter sp. EGI 63066]|uniref:TetR/AcrR family transcriptional regulator n=1 Tax=Galbibacter sp. EGI 63066 TaxID=2993559 RepID=UPI00224908E5|nr:TetR/AcrR family transcriptional regulator [Galbibacter sp. EGI 63066]MCX2680189.1 TetR/AcrR family transcriptional regulator [Galbibacter sp. EGI 63066]